VCAVALGGLHLATEERPGFKYLLIADLGLVVGFLCRLLGRRATVRSIRVICLTHIALNYTLFGLASTSLKKRHTWSQRRAGLEPGFARSLARPPYYAPLLGGRL
jgi:hypothetical protein